VAFLEERAMDMALALVVLESAIINPKDRNQTSD
jgi:hypothetical protein